VGSSIGNNCDDNGQCQCLPNIVGLKCDDAADGFYIPDLHQLKFEIEDGFTDNGKSVRYNFDDESFPNFSWKGFVNLNKNIGTVSQNIKIEKTGTYRMIVKYKNTNTQTAQVAIEVKHNSSNDIQSATFYLQPAQEPSYETVTVNRISALILELEADEYTFSLKNLQDNLLIDYFVLLPSNFFESTVLSDSIKEACQDYRDPHLCIQYKYNDISHFNSQLMYDDEKDSQDESLKM
jgi:laminin, alpha 3/5